MSLNELLLQKSELDDSIDNEIMSLTDTDKAKLHDDYMKIYYEKELICNIIRDKEIKKLDTSLEAFEEFKQRNNAKRIFNTVKDFCKCKENNEENNSTTNPAINIKDAIRNILKGKNFQKVGEIHSSLLCNGIDVQKKKVSIAIKSLRDDKIVNKNGDRWQAKYSLV